MSNWRILNYKLWQTHGKIEKSIVSSLWTELLNRRLLYIINNNNVIRIIVIRISWIMTSRITGKLLVSSKHQKESQVARGTWIQAKVFRVALNFSWSCSLLSAWFRFTLFAALGFALKRDRIFRNPVDFSSSLLDTSPPLLHHFRPTFLPSFELTSGSQMTERITIILPYQKSTYPRVYVTSGTKNQTSDGRICKIYVLNVIRGRILYV